MYPPELDSEGYIVGIHNYCDRWCERCQFTEQCRIYEPRPLDEEGLPKAYGSEEFMDEVMHNFDKAIEMLHNMAQEHGLDLGDLDKAEAVQEYQRQQDLREQAIQVSQASKLTQEYMEQLNR